MKYQAHRGVGSDCPENTMPAFIAASMQGFDIIELDPAFTVDGVCVVMHDSTINRTCRNADGSAIANETRVCDITFGELMGYDAGIYKDVKFKGTKVPALSEVLRFAAENGLTVKIDNKIERFTKEQREAIYSAVNSSGADTAFTCFSFEHIREVVKYCKNSAVHYDGAVDLKALETIKEIVNGKPFTVWLALPSKITSWVKVPLASPELCTTVRKYAALGIWTVCSDEQLEQAKRLGADIVETTGSIKPYRRENGYVDLHSHTFHSHDGKQSAFDIYAKAKEMGLAGFAVTDHCDVEYTEKTDILSPILQSNDDVRALPCDLITICGVEMGESLWNTDEDERIVSSTGFDVVLGSVHAVKSRLTDKPYSRIDFSEYSDGEIDEFLKDYFNEMYGMLCSCNFDVLCHLTCPLRYIRGKYGRSVDLELYREQIDMILKKTVERNIALEINTSCLGGGYDEFMPDSLTVKRYRELGGRLVTVGSDAHVTENVGKGLAKAAAMLRENGFEYLYYYKNRIPVQYAIEA